MPKFSDIIAALKADGLDLAALPELADQLEAAHTEELTTETSIRDAKITTATTELETLRANEVALKAKNYDLVMAAAAAPKDPDPNPEDAPEPTLDDLFEK